jgi:gliding motility-associated-like protein
LVLKKHIALIFSLITITIISNGQSPKDMGTVCAGDTSYFRVSGIPGSFFTWMIDTNVGVQVENDRINFDENNDTIEVVWLQNTGTFRIEVQETINNCTGTSSVGIVKIQTPLVNLGYDYYDICRGDSMIFDASGNYESQPIQYKWFDNSTKPTYLARNSNIIWVKVTDALGCSHYDSVDFVVHELPKVNLGRDTILCDETEPLTLDAGSDYVYYDWKTTSGDNYSNNPVYIYPVKIPVDSIIVKVTDIHTCMGSDTIIILECDVRQLFKNMPNTFTPNGDNSNDTWNIPYMEQFPNAVLEIFDRWGRLVYHTDNVLEEPWDGTSNGREMPMDSYFFVLDLKFHHAEPITGSVNLIR